LPDGEDGVPVARPFWSGTITFGLVSIPVDLLSANRSRGVALRMVDRRDGELLKREYICPDHDKALDDDEIARGYELDDGSFVTVTDEELEAVAPDKSRDIDLTSFVPASDIDPLYFQRAYFLAPSGRSSKAYHLLTETMERSGRAGIGTFVMRGKEHLVAIFAEGGLLRAATLRFADELRAADEIDARQKKPQTKLVQSIIRDIRKLSHAKLDTSALEDPYPQQLESLVQRKAANDQDLIEPSTPVDEVSSDDNVIDLLEALKKRVGVPSGRSTSRPGLRKAKKTGRSSASTRRPGVRKAKAPRSAATSPKTRSTKTRGRTKSRAAAR
jgi:DNA end-binding protein Ku